MQILLTGPTSFTGPHVLERLLARGDAVRVLELREAADRVPHRERLEVIAGSLSNMDALREATRDVEVIYHLGQLRATQDRETADLVRVNVHGTENLLRAGVDAGTRRFVYISSVKVYSPAPWPSMWPITEDAPQRAHGNEDMRRYGQTKIDAERTVLSFHREHGMEYVIMRPSETYGCGAEFVEDLLEQIVTAPQAALARGAQLGAMQWVHVNDLAEAIILAGTRAQAANEVFNVAGDEVITVWDVARVVRELLMRRTHLGTRDQTKPRGDYEGRYDLSKAKVLLGYTPRVDLREGLQAMLDEMYNRRLPLGGGGQRQEYRTAAPRWTAVEGGTPRRPFMRYNSQGRRRIPSRCGLWREI